MALNDRYFNNEYIVVKALENGVTIIGLTRGTDTKFHHSEKLDKEKLWWPSLRNILRQ